MENSNFFAADTTVFQIVSMGGSTRRLWKGANFQDVEIMVVPMNITTRHWTLLVCSVTAPFNNMRTLKFKAQPTNAFFTTVNQMLAGSSHLSTAAERAVIKSLCTV